MRTLLFMLASVFMFIVAGCDDPSSGTTKTYLPGFQSERSVYFLEGTVVDRQQRPVSGAAIHFLFTQSFINFSKTQSPAKAMPSSTISFGIPADGYVSLRIYRLGTRELVAVMVDSTLRAGRHTISANISPLTNGIYVYQLVAGNIYQEHLMMLLNNDLSTLTAATPLTTTNNEGRFRIPQSVFGLDETFSVTSEKGPDIIGQARIDSIGIVIHCAGETQVQWMRINKQSNMYVTFTLQ
jgi:hypothetical protein